MYVKFHFSLIPVNLVVRMHQPQIRAFQVNAGSKKFEVSSGMTCTADVASLNFAPTRGPLMKGGGSLFFLAMYWSWVKRYCRCVTTNSLKEPSAILASSVARLLASVICPVRYPQCGEHLMRVNAFVPCNCWCLVSVRISNQKKEEARSTLIIAIVFWTGASLKQMYQKTGENGGHWRL